MLFASGIFLYVFLPIFLAAYYLTPRSWRTLTIALASYVFYGWWRPDFVLLMWISTAVDYCCGRAIEAERLAQPEPKGAGKRWLLLSLTVNLGLLAYFKYANFGIDTLNVLLAQAGMEGVEWPKVVLPVGISFYTFQTLSYTVDVYRGVAPTVRSLRDFACYVAMFPQLVAGPIVRYNTIAQQLHDRPHTLRGFARGVLAFQAGLAKKVLIADPLGGLADAAFDSHALAEGSLSALDAWIGIFAYTFQIYFDFSGYSDMAIGLGLMIGFRLPINFNRPYVADSITDFWRRWHISLSSFLRDYLYIPLGGNRRGSVRTYVNLALTMLLGGLWHGAAWTFVLWGAWQGLWLILERLAGRRPFYRAMPRVARIAFTFFLVMIGWVLFRAESFVDARIYLAALFGADGAPRLLVQPIHVITGFIGALLLWATPTTQDLLTRLPRWWIAALQFVFVLALLHLHFEDHVPFLYYQF